MKIYEINDGREILNLPVKCKGINNSNFCWEHEAICWKNSETWLFDHWVIMSHGYNITQKMRSISVCETLSIFIKDGKGIMFHRIPHSPNTWNRNRGINKQTNKKSKPNQNKKKINQINQNYTYPLLWNYCY